METEACIIHRDSLPADLRADLLRWEEEIFPDTPGFDWERGPWFVVLWADGRWVSALQVLDRAVTVGGEEVRVGGVARVMTRPDERGKGCGLRLMQAANAFICETLGAPFGLLVCGTERIDFYERAGWRRATGPTTCTQPDGDVTFDGENIITMVYACAEPWPAGPINLNGLPW